MGADADAIDAARPVAPSTRIQVIDALRGFALCGILLINIIAMGGPIAADAPSGPPGLHDPDWQVQWASILFVEGAMRALFSILFGAGMLLFLRELGDAGAARGRARLFMRRAGWLILFGVVNCTVLLWPGDILLIYGMAAFLILPFTRAPPRSLLIVAAGLVVLLAAWSALNALGGPAAGGDAAHAAAGYARERAARLGGYPENLRFMLKTTWEWTWTPQLFWWVLDGTAAMLIGMALLKLGVLTGEASARLYRRMAVFGFAIALPLGLLEAWLASTHPGDEQPLARALLQPRRLALAFAYIGLIMLIWRSGAARRLFAPFAALGRVALSGYLGQSVLAALVFCGFGLALWDRLNWPGRWGVAAAIMVLEMVLAVLWLRWFRFGPMEWLWRWLTYGERPKLRLRRPSS